MKPVKEQEWETRTGLSSESYDNSRRRGITKLYHQLIKYNIETQIEKILIIGKQRKLTKKEEVNLIRIDQLITKILLKSERRINSHPIPQPYLKTLPKLLPNQLFTLLLPTKDQYPSPSLQNQPISTKHGHCPLPISPTSLSSSIIFSTSSQETESSNRNIIHH